MKKILIRFVTRAYISAVSIILFFFVCELGISIFLPSVAPPERVFLTPFASDENRDAGVRKAFVSSFFIEDPELFWRLDPARSGGEVTGEGFRGRSLYGEKKRDIYRIIAMGDSCTYGVGADGIDSSYPAKLEQILNKNLSRKVEVINAGVPGYASLQGLRYLKRIAPEYRPDLIIIQYLHNDGVAWLNCPDSRVAVPGDLARNVQLVLRKWRLYELLRRSIARARGFFARLRSTGEAMPYRVSPDEYKQNLVEMVNCAKDNGADALLIIPPALPPYRYRPDFTDYQKATAAASAETGAPLLDVAAVFDSIDDSRSLFWRPEEDDLAHLNSKGYAIEAEAVADKIKRIAH